MGRRNPNEERSSMFPKREERVSLGETGQRNRTPKKPRGQRPPRQPRPNRDMEVEEDGIGFMERIQEFWEEKKEHIPKPRFSKKFFGILGGLLVILCLYIAFVAPNGTEVLLDGTRVGILEQRNVSAEEIITIIEEQLATSVGSEVQLNEEITTQSLHISNTDKKDIGTEEYLIPKIRNMVTYQVNAAALYVDGRKELAVATTDMLNSLLEELQSPYLVDIGEDVTVSWVENVEVVEEFVDMTEVLSIGDALTYLQTVRWTVGEYQVQQGDALYAIAINNNTTVEDILALNPEISVERGLYAGETIQMMIAEPKISVQTVELQEYTMVEPKDYEYRYDSSLATGQKQVLQQGRAGQKLSIVEVTRVNGFVVSEVEISKEIIVEPITEIIVEGTG